MNLSSTSLYSACGISQFLDGISQFLRFIYTRFSTFIRTIHDCDLIEGDSPPARSNTQKFSQRYFEAVNSALITCACLSRIRGRDGARPCSNENPHVYICSSGAGTRCTYLLNSLAVDRFTSNRFHESEEETRVEKAISTAKLVDE